MIKVTDIRLDDSGDVSIKNGDFETHISDPTHIEHILLSNKGYWFENPLLGVGIIDEIKGNTSAQELKQNIRRNLVLDEFSVKGISISSDSEINIDAIRRI